MLSKFKNLTLGGDAPEGRPDHGDHDQSLVTVLPTREDRANLLLLIADSTQAMRAQILDAFDPKKTETATPLKLNRSPDQPQDGLGESLPVGERVPDKPPTSDDAPGQPEKTAEDAEKDAEADKKEQEKLKKALEKRVKDVTKLDNVQLKEAALAHFDDWRDKVLQRVGEAINERGSDSEPGTKPVSRPASRDQPSTRGSPDGRLQQILPPTDSPLRDFSEARRILIMHSVLLLLLGLEAYPAESRVLMLRIASSLGASMELLAQDEISVAKGLLEVARQQMNADQETKKKVDENSTARKWKVGLGAVAGAVLIGVTGGLAAPLLAAGVGSVMGGLGLGATATAGYLGALAGSAPLVGVLFGAYGGRMTGKMVDEYAKQVEDFAFLPINKPSLFHKAKDDDKNARHLRVTVGISGWLAEEHEVELPWKVISGKSTEAFALRWELQALLRLGHALNIYIKSYAWGFAKKEILSRTIFAALASALTLPYGLAKASRVIDNPFSVAMSRSEKAGVVLADALINKVQGERPVTLIGYSLGARVIYSCLNELAERKKFGLVESVCLMGSPVPSDPIVWRRMRSVVAGRLINVYSTKDYLLAFLYRANNLQYGIGGTQAIPDVQGIENVDVSDLVDGHTQYRFLVGNILQNLGLEDIDSAAVEQQMKKLRRVEEEVKEERKRRAAEGKSAEDEAEEMEKEVERNNINPRKQADTKGLSIDLSKSGSSVEKTMTEENKLRGAEKP